MSNEQPYQPQDQPAWGPQGEGAYQQPPSGYQQPPGGYQQPPGGFQQAPGGYGAPAPYGAGYAPSPPPGTYFDQQSGLFLPEGTTLATSGRRIGAWFLGVLLLIVTLVIGYAIWSLVVYGKGKTPKFQVLGMRVVRADNGQVAGWGEMAMRELVGCFVLDRVLAPITWIISLVLVLTRADRKGLPDLIGSTVVVYDPNKVLDSVS